MHQCNTSVLIVVVTRTTTAGGAAGITASCDDSIDNRSDSFAHQEPIVDTLRILFGKRGNKPNEVKHIHRKKIAFDRI